MMFGQMTAGSWIYIGTQGILQGTYETFAACGRTHFGVSDRPLAGKIVMSAGLGGMGGAQPLAASLAGAAFLGVEVDANRARRRLETGYIDEVTDDATRAWQRVKAMAAQGRAGSVGLIGNIAEVLPKFVEMVFVPDVLTDQTSAHDPLVGYIPAGLSIDNASTLRQDDSNHYPARWST